MGFLDRFRKKSEQQTEAKDQKDSSPPPTGKRIKKYTSEGKPVYE